MDWTVNPKTAMVLNIAMAVVLGLAGAGALFTDLFGEHLAKTIVASCGLMGVVLGAINAGLNAVSTHKAGPLAKYVQGDSE